MATIASGGSSYASVNDLLNRFDLRPLQQLLSDTTIPLPPSQLQTVAALSAILQEASGVLEAAAVVGQRYNIGPSAPPAPGTPTVTTATTGGTVAAGVYGVELTYSNTVGESLSSVSTSITTTGSTSTVTVASPKTIAIATGYNVYMTQAGGTTYTLQNANLLALGTAFVLSAPPGSTGAAPPTSIVNTQNDLQAIATSGTNSAQYLIGIVCSIAYAMIWERRPEWLGANPEKPGWRVQMAMDAIDKIRDGTLIFGTVEGMQAGELNDVIESEQVLQQQQRTTFVSRPFFGRRVADIVGSNPPPHTYP